MAEKSESRKSEKACATSGVRQLSEFIRRKKLVSDEHGKIILVDTENEDSIKLKKQVETLEAKINSILSIDKSIRKSLTKLMVDWAHELKALEYADAKQTFQSNFNPIDTEQQNVSTLKMEDLDLAKRFTTVASVQLVKERDQEKVNSHKSKEKHSSQAITCKSGGKGFFTKNEEPQSRNSMSSLVSALDLADSKSRIEQVCKAERVNISSCFSTDDSKSHSDNKRKVSDKAVVDQEKESKDIPVVPESIFRDPSSYFKILNQAKTFKDLKRIVTDFTRWQRSHHPYTRFSLPRVEIGEKSGGSGQRLLKSNIDRRRNSSNPSDCFKDYNLLLASVPKTLKPQPSSGQLIGEIAFQLERRILAYIFKGERVTVEYNISNIERMIKLHHVRKKDILMQRNKDVFQRLSCCGLRKRRHISLILGLIEAYGTYSHVNVAKKRATEEGWNNHRQLKYDLLQLTPTNLLHDVIIIIDCLKQLARADNKDVFLW